MKRKKTGLVLGTLVGLFILIQIIPVNFTNPPVQAEQDFLVVNQASDEVAQKLKQSCYDCHSNETKYPWYSKVAPVSWLLKEHIDDGRRHLNFSTWDTYDLKKKDHKLEEISEALEEGWMPMDQYLWMHKEAELSAAERQELSNWMKQLRTALSAPTENSANAIQAPVTEAEATPN